MTFQDAESLCLILLRGALTAEERARTDGYPPSATRIFFAEGRGVGNFSESKVEMLVSRSLFLGVPLPVLLVCDVLSLQ